MNSDQDTLQVALGGWVAPFGDPGINDRSHLPRAFRSVPRPSSPLSAKASTRCPSFALERHTQRQRSSIEPANSPLPAEPEVPPLKTLRDPADRPPGTHAQRAARGLLSQSAIACANHRIPPRSHNSLLHICPSTTGQAAPPPIGTDAPRPNSVLLPRSDCAAPDTGAFGATDTAALGETRGFACRGRRNVVPPGVEVNGFEPMTSCLQSRRSPS
jgi:hypothetical protein